MQIDVFTLVPHAFALDDRAAAASPPCSGRRARAAPASATATSRRCGQVRWTTSRTAAGPGWCCASTSSTPRSAPSTATSRRSGSIALSPQGRQLDQQLVEELAGEGRLTLLSARFEGFDERVVEHLATETRLDRPVRPLRRRAPRDGGARRDRAPAARGARREESLAGRDVLRGARDGASSTRTTPGRPSTGAGRCPSVLLSGEPRPDRRLAAERSQRAEPPLRGPIDRLTARSAEPVADRRRLGADDRDRGRRRAPDQGVRRQPVPDSLLVDGADPALRAARPRLRGELQRPRDREPLHLPLPRPGAGRHRRLRPASRGDRRRAARAART